MEAFLERICWGVLLFFTPHLNPNEVMCEKMPRLMGRIEEKITLETKYDLQLGQGPGPVTTLLQMGKTITGLCETGLQQRHHVAGRSRYSESSFLLKLEI